MSYVNGIVGSPVTMSDIKQAVGYDSGKLGVLISNGSINKWSRMKPVRSLSKGILSDSDMKALAFGLSWAGGLGDSKYTYNRPRGRNGGGSGIHEWFRKLDFEGYRSAIASGMVFAQQYSFDTIRQYGSSVTIKTMSDGLKICLSDLKDTIFSGYKVRLFVYDLIGSEAYHWYSSWVNIASGQTSFTIPWNTLANTLPVSEYNLILQASNDNGNSIIEPFVSNGILNITADSGISVSGWGYNMTVYKSGGANSASYYRAGVYTHYMDISGNYFGIQGLPVTNASGRTISNSDIYLYISWWENGTHYYTRCRTNNGASAPAWSLANGSTESYSPCVLDSDFPRLGNGSDAAYTYTAVSMYLEARTPISGGRYVYSRISDVLTLNLRRTNGDDGIPI